KKGVARVDDGFECRHDFIRFWIVKKWHPCSSCFTWPLKGVVSVPVAPAPRQYVPGPARMGAPVLPVALARSCQHSPRYRARQRCCVATSRDRCDESRNLRFSVKIQLLSRQTVPADQPQPDY